MRGVRSLEQLDIENTDTELSHLPCTASTSFFASNLLLFQLSPIRPRGGFHRRQAKGGIPSNPTFFCRSVYGGN